MLTKEFGSKFEIGAYLTLVMGVLGDQISTRVGLARPQISEFNPITSSMIARGLWVPMDVALVAVCVLIPFIMNRMMKHTLVKTLCLYPLIAGLIRLGACVWNFFLLI